ncbi:MAG: ATP synthase F1 subunit delta [Planctomycetes bacterium]|nr:ATP synthase F1 subunit delta [Planctomycetota bacterium]
MQSETLIDPVASRWAQALYELAQKKGALDEVRKDMGLLAQALESAKVRAFLEHSSIPLAEKEKVFSSVTQSLSQWTQNTVRLAFERRREGLLPNLPAAFQRREDELSGTLQGVVESVRELGASEMESLTASLTKEFQKTVVLTQRRNPDLVGGVRIFVGAYMIDRSVQGRMDDLRRRLRTAPLATH